MHPTRLLPTTLLLVTALLMTGCFGSSSSDLVGVWHFASGESGGYSTSVYGTLTLEANGRYVDNHRIADTLSYSKGTYKTSSGRLSLTPDTGTGNPASYNYHLDTQKDSTGKEFPAMTLTASGLSFLLTRAE